MNEIDVTLKSLRQMIRELNAKQLKGAVRGTIRKEANLLRRKAVTYMKQSAYTQGGVWRKVGDIAKKGVRAYIYKDFSGFIVKAAPGKSAGFWRNSKGKEKPLALWINTGGYNRRTRKGDLNRGTIYATDYVKKAEQYLPGVYTRLGESFEKQVSNIVNKINK